MPDPGTPENSKNQDPKCVDDEILAKSSNPSLSNEKKLGMFG